VTLLNGFVQRRFQVGIVGRQNDQVVDRRCGLPHQSQRAQNVNTFFLNPRHNPFTVGIAHQAALVVVAIEIAQRTKMNFDPRISLPMRLLGKTTGIRSLIVLGRRQASIDED